jgi:hypothetical protein
MSEKPRIVGVTGGAVGLSALALAFGVCCVAPWAVTLLGVAGAVLLARLAFIQPYVVAATIVLLGTGFWFVYRRPRAAAECDLVQQRRLRWLVWGDINNRRRRPTHDRVNLRTVVFTRSKTMVVAENMSRLPNIADALITVRNNKPLSDQPDLLRSFERWFYTVARDIRPMLAEEPLRLLKINEYRAAVISAVTLLESQLRSALEMQGKLEGRAYSLSAIADLSVRRGLISEGYHQNVRDWMSVRNRVVHSQEVVSKVKATEIVSGVLSIVQSLGIEP